MPVFNMLWKIMKRKKGVILMYSCIFIISFVSISSLYSSGEVSGYTVTKTELAIKDLDQSDTSKAFVKYMEEKAIVKDLKEINDETIKDALFFDEIAYFIEIPKGFQDALTSDTPMKLRSQSGLDSTHAIVSEQLVNGYLQNLTMYKKLTPNRSIVEIDAQIRELASKQVDVSFANGETIDEDVNLLGTYFNLLFYIFTASIIMVGGTILLIVYNQEIRKRNLLSPITQVSYNAQLALGCICFAIAYWGVFMVVVEIIIGGLLSEMGLYFMINSLAMVFVSMGVTFLLAILLSGKRSSGDVLTACSNVIALGSSFLCGVFIPQFVLGESIKLFSSFLPAYWYVKANEMIASMQINPLQVSDWLGCVGIQVLYGIVFFLLALWISKNKASSKSFS